ncbi:oxidoreductase subunit [Escherichia coli]|nr:oxidoreductase subunit [Escherichia coli]
MLPSETMIWQPEFTDKTLSRKPGAVHYKEMGWDPQLGCPTRETLQRLGLEDIAADLAAHNLLPV